MRGFLSCLCAAALSLSSAAAMADGEALNPLRAVEKSSLDGFLRRPLFSLSRRPPQPAPPPAAGVQAPEPSMVATRAPSPPPRLRLTGVIAGGAEAVAVVTNLDSNATETLRLGDMLNGWLVTSIEPVALRMTLDDRDEEFRLFARERLN